MSTQGKTKFLTVLLLLIVSLTSTTIKPVDAESVSPSVAWNTPNSGNVELDAGPTAPRTSTMGYLLSIPLHGH